ncbi:hypothetical protein MAPG_11709 [Magnaporthiopsis poae ATCC 64411]|uniref:Uncharacterized protein n=1 Tax=Magnaporthiopsis poae (strain ATCC 64411 / 73-15) TaxID=644358 RepID=A0A0C4EFZ7_MAGP6|nr:hypothetical protein MAPG_11709 [Magnaporthiopsis poae ATCC 64411]
MAWKTYILVVFMRFLILALGQLEEGFVRDFVAGFAPQLPDKDGHYQQYIAFSVRRTNGGVNMTWHECVSSTAADATDGGGTLKTVDYTSCLHTGDPFGPVIQFSLADAGEGAFQLRLIWDLPGPKGVKFGNYIIRASDLKWMPYWGHDIQMYAGVTEFGFVVDQFGQPDPTTGL